MTFPYTGPACCGGGGGRPGGAARPKRTSSRRAWAEPRRTERRRTRGDNRTVQRRTTAADRAEVARRCGGLGSAGTTAPKSAGPVRCRAPTSCRPPGSPAPIERRAAEEEQDYLKARPHPPAPGEPDRRDVSRRIRLEVRPSREEPDHRDGIMTNPDNSQWSHCCPTVPCRPGRSDLPRTAIHPRLPPRTERSGDPGSRGHKSRPSGAQGRLGVRHCVAFGASHEAP